MLNFEQIKALIELVADRDLGRVEIERSGFRLEIESGLASSSAAAELTSSSRAAAEAPVPAETPAVTVAEVAAKEAPAAAASEDELPAGAHLMSSPIVGTFFRAPNPDSSPFVEIGDKVDQGEVLCIVEAMKLMNEIEADVGGTILKIYPQNGQPVEYGEPLFAIEPR